MNKFIAILLCLGVALPAAYGACAAAATFTALGLTSQAAATLGAAPTYCTRLFGGSVKSCCDTATLTGFQTKTDGFVSTLKTTFASKDQAILDARRNTINLKANFTALAAYLANATSQLTTWKNGADATIAAKATKVANFATTFSAWYAAVITNYQAIYQNFDFYQTNRSTCVAKLLQVNANARCLACGDDADGFFDAANSNALGPDATTSNDLLAACYTYVNASVYQSNILEINSYNTSLTSMMVALTSIASGTSSALDTFITIMTTVSGNTHTPAPAATPASCTSTACTFITSTLFSNGVAGMADPSQTNLVRGGDAYSFPTRRLLGESRLLVTTWTYTSTASGVTISFPANPGNVVNQSDAWAGRVGVLASLVALFVAFLF